jgi:hypothetical protein
VGAAVIAAIATAPVAAATHLIFYVEHESRFDVWRVLHMRHDIPTHHECPAVCPRQDSNLRRTV